MEYQKICRKCYESKNKSDFYNNKHTKDKKSSYCKSCAKEEAKKYNKGKGKENLYKIQRNYRIRCGKQNDPNIKQLTEEQIKRKEKYLDNKIKQLKITIKLHEELIKENEYDIHELEGRIKIYDKKKLDNNNYDIVKLLLN